MNGGSENNTAIKSGKTRGVGRTIILAILIVATVLIAALTVEYILKYPNDMDITYSTVVREPLPKECVNETDYYTDELNLLSYDSELLPGLEKFHELTGVQPYIYLTGHSHDMWSTPNETEKKKLAESKYKDLFTDEAHLLLVVFKDDEYSYLYDYNSRYICWYAAGQKAASVIDTEAGDILIEYLDKYYDDQSLTYEQYFSKVFGLTAERIMSVTTYPLLFIVLFVMLGLLVIVGLIFLVLKYIKKEKERSRRIHGRDAQYPS